MEINPQLKEMTAKDLYEKKIILESLGCTEKQTINIIGSNALYLDRSISDITNLIKTLNKYNFKTLNILFDANPYILNMDSYEIEEYIQERLYNNEELEDIIDDLTSNPYLFNDM